MLYERRAVGVEIDFGARAYGACRRLREQPVERRLGRRRRAGTRLIRGRDDEPGADVVRVAEAVRIEAALVLIDRVALGPIQAEHDIAAVVRAVHAQEHAAAGVAGIALVGLTALDVHIHALEVLLQDEVHDTGDGVGTVHRRSTTGDRLDTLDGGQRDGVQINHETCVARLPALAIDQHQVAVVAQAAQVDGGRARRLRRSRLHLAGELGGRWHELGLLVQDRLDVGRGSIVQRIRTDRRDRARGFEVARARNTRTGDGDFGKCLFTGRRGRRALIGGGRRVCRESRLRQRGTADRGGNGHGYQVPRRAKGHRSTLLISHILRGHTHPPEQS